jgi:hypothetical protein
MPQYFLEEVSCILTILIKVSCLPSPSTLFMCTSAWIKISAYLQAVTFQHMSDT